MTFPIYGKIKHVPNHQPVTHHWICPNRPYMTLLCVQTTVRTWFQGKFVKHRLSYPNDLGCFFKCFFPICSSELVLQCPTNQSIAFSELFLQRFLAKNDGCVQKQHTSWTPMDYNIWLVVYLKLKNMKVSWDDDIPSIWKNKTCSKPPTRYIAIIISPWNCHDSGYLHLCPMAGPTDNHLPSGSPPSYTWASSAKDGPRCSYCGGISFSQPS